MYIHLEDDVIDKKEFCEDLDRYVKELSENTRSYIQIPTSAYSTSATVISTKKYDELLRVKELYKEHLNELDDKKMYSSFNDALF